MLTATAGCFSGKGAEVLINGSYRAPVVGISVWTSVWLILQPLKGVSLYDEVELGEPPAEELKSWAPSPMSCSV